MCDNNLYLIVGYIVMMIAISITLRMYIKEYKLRLELQQEVDRLRRMKYE